MHYLKIVINYVHNLLYILFIICYFKSSLEYFGIPLQLNTSRPLGDLAMDSYTQMYDAELARDLNAAKEEMAFKMCPVDRVFYGYWEDYHGVMHLVTDENYDDYQDDDRVVWL